MKILNLHEVQERLVSSGVKFFTASDLMVIFKTKKRAAQMFLAYNVNKGAIVRLKPGLFILANNRPQEFTVANRLYIPSYISLDSALSFHHLIPETIYTITSVTTKPTREFVIGGTAFDYRRIKQKAFTGYIPENINGETVYIATAEKAVADFLYFISLGKRKGNDRLKMDKVNLSQVEKYRNLFKE